MEEDFDVPIDIPAVKILDWLQSRRHIDSQWKISIIDIRKKINHSLQDMPEHPDIIKLLSGTYINYYHCLEIVKILYETEKDSKNIFGWYTSKRMKDWQNIVSLYETNNVYLAEICDFIFQNVKYEIPSYKKETSICQDHQNNCLNKVQNRLKSSNDFKEKYKQICKENGLSGDEHKMKEELRLTVNKLHVEFEKVAEEIKKLSPACKFYKQFLEFVSSKQNRLPLLKFIIENGNATVYQWEHGVAPSSIEKEVSCKKSDTETSNDDCQVSEEGVRGGVEEDLAEAAAEIDWGGGEDAGEINWGDEGGDPDLEILNISEVPQVTCESADSENGSYDIVVERHGEVNGVAKGTMALSILQNSATRKIVLNEFAELKAFLESRRLCMSSVSVLSTKVFSEAPDSLQKVDGDSIKEFVDCVNGVIRGLTNSAMNKLYMIESSPRYVERLIQSFKAPLRQSEHEVTFVAPLQREAERHAQKKKQIRPQLEAATTKTKELIDLVQIDISAKYKDRKVNIMTVL